MKHKKTLRPIAGAAIVGAYQNYKELVYQVALDQASIDLSEIENNDFKKKPNEETTTTPSPTDKTSSVTEEYDSREVSGKLGTPKASTDEGSAVDKAVSKFTGNPKTGIESLTSVTATLIASVGALVRYR